MPAVELSRLTKQADELAGFFYQPVEFRRLLIERLEFYADRVTRPGARVRPAPLIPRYGVPTLFLQTVEMVLQKPAGESPDDALLLAKELWKEDHLEPRLIAATLIGKAAGKLPREAANMLSQYCVAQENPLVQEALLQRSGVQLREANLVVWFDLVERWINSEFIPQQIIGFKALQNLIDDRDFENLPVVFRILTFPVETTNRATINELEPLLISLFRRSQMETAYFLRQITMRAQNPILERLIRRLSPYFPDGYKLSREIPPR